jgi:hypothetical protein
MSRIQIADLQSTGTELFQGNESFLTDLQSVEASAIYGGKGCVRKAGRSKKGKSSGGKIGCSSKSSGGKSSGGGTCPPPPGGGGIITPPGGGVVPPAGGG